MPMQGREDMKGRGELRMINALDSPPSPDKEIASQFPQALVPSSPPFF